MMNRRQITRRMFVFGAASSLIIFNQSLEAADFDFTQYHNQPSDSPLHLRLVEMWAAIRSQTNGRVVTRVLPENNKIPNSDPQTLQMLISNKIQFFTLMGGILGNVVPVAEVQQVPFAFRTSAEAHAAMDGALGVYLRDEMAAQGIQGFAV